MRDNLVSLYNRTYKLFLIIPIIMLIFSIIYLVGFYQKNGDIIDKDVSLTGGTSITVFDKNIDIEQLKQKIEVEFPDNNIRGISDIGGGGQRGFTIEIKAEIEEIKPTLEKILGYKLDEKNSSIEFSGASLSQGFYQQLISAIIAAFLLMSWVVFLIFSESRKIKGIFTMISFFAVAVALITVSGIKTLALLGIVAGYVYSVYKKEGQKRHFMEISVLGLVLIVLMYLYPINLFLGIAIISLIYISIKYSIPSFAVILSAFADIVMTVAVVNLLGMTLSSAGIIAFLMLIGYSVDTDILLTSRLLKKKEGNINYRLWGAFKTGITMSLTSIAAVMISLIIVSELSETLRQIFTIVSIGLFLDIFNTWLTNASMLKWYMEAKKIE